MKKILVTAVLLAGLATGCALVPAPYQPTVDCSDTVNGRVQCHYVLPTTNTSTTTTSSTTTTTTSPPAS